jgi:hypothetical protein
MVAGVSIAVDLWVLRGGAASGQLHIIGLARVMWLGFGINLLSGIALLLAYPAKALTNWVFYFKMVLVLLGVWVAARINRELMAAQPPAAFDARRWAIASLLLWTGAIVTGRLLAYTAHVLFTYELT